MFEPLSERIVKSPSRPKALANTKISLGKPCFFIKGSRTSGDFSIERSGRLVQLKFDLGLHLLGQGVIDQS